MNGPDFEVHSTPVEDAEKTDQAANSPTINSDPFVDKVPVNKGLIHETPMGGTIAAVGPLNQPVDNEVPMVETPNQEIPMGGTIAAVSPMNETIVHEPPVVAETPNQVWMLETDPFQNPVVEKVTPAVPVVTNAGSLTSLFPRDVAENFRTRWNEIQGKFVDEPHTAVQQADTLVSEVIKEITQVFEHEHSSIGGQWKEVDDFSTEDLRKTLQLYRTFFNRLVG